MRSMVFFVLTFPLVLASAGCLGYLSGEMSSSADINVRKVLAANAVICDASEAAEEAFSYLFTARSSDRDNYYTCMDRFARDLAVLRNAVGNDQAQISRLNRIDEKRIIFNSSMEILFNDYEDDSIVENRDNVRDLFMSFNGMNDEIEAVASSMMNDAGLKLSDRSYIKAMDAMKMQAAMMRALQKSYAAILFPECVSPSDFYMALGVFNKCYEKCLVHVKASLDKTDDYDLEGIGKSRHNIRSLASTILSEYTATGKLPDSMMEKYGSESDSMSMMLYAFSRKAIRSL